MSELTPNALHAELRTLIASSRQRLAGVQFAVAFPASENVASLMRHLSWTPFPQLLPSLGLSGQMA